MSRKVFAAATAVAACGWLAGTRVLHVHAASPASQNAPSARADAARGTTAPGAGQSGAAATSVVLNKYCISCHSERLKTGGLVLTGVDLEHVGDAAETWEKVALKLRAGAMPPAGLPRPDPATYATVASWFEDELDRAAARRPNPGRPVVRRLNRSEYTNAIRDLLAVDIDARALLPTDESGYGFDNIGNVLSISSGLLDRYMSAARKISRVAVGDPTMGPTVQTYTLSRYLLQHDRMSDDLPFESRGGAVIRHFFPRDGEYTLTVGLGKRFDNDAVQGLGVREELDVRLDGARVKLFAVGGECVGSKEPRCIKPIGTVPASEYEHNADRPLHVQFSVKAGTHGVGVAFLKKHEGAVEGPGPIRLARSVAQGEEAGEPMNISTVTLEGPFNPSGLADTPSRRRIFACRPASAADEEPCATKILGALVRRAYRRPVTAEDLDPLRGLYQIGRATGNFETGVQFALEGLLVSPDFLLRIEHDPAKATPGGVYRISDVELASRLSFFLWNTIPDDELLNVAARGKLSDPATREQQVRRMLADPRASGLVTNFVGQWLYVRDLRAATPDTIVFPEFDDTLRDAFQQETELFVESQMRDDRPLMELLTANYTFVNERLAEFYGIPHVYGSHFRRVALTDPKRMGILGQGSLLTVTSYSTRTSPVQRGQFVLANILGSPPPPPPPNVPALEEASDRDDAPKTVRARMEAHRKSPVCASCHARMDPIGFALENFNGIGKWRKTEFGAPIDSAGVFPDGTRMSGPADLRTVLASHRDEVVRTFTGKLLTYALGRGVEYYDGPAIRKIVRDAAATDYRWVPLILGVVNSMPFQMKIVGGQEANPQSSVAVAGNTPSRLK